LEIELEVSPITDRNTPRWTEIKYNRNYSVGQTQTEELTDVASLARSRASRAAARRSTSVISSIKWLSWRPVSTAKWCHWNPTRC